MEDDLEYHISFPVPDHSNTEIIPQGITEYHGNRPEDFYQNCRSLKIEPVIFLLGWLGAQDRHLSKYSSMYNKLGCITVRYTAPSDSLFISPDKKLKPIAEKLLKLLEDTGLSNNPVIFHNFSNHGSILYSYISRTMETCNDLTLKVKGCIFDSAPAPRRLSSAVRAVYRCVEGPFWLKFLTSSAICIYLWCCSVINLFSTLLSGHWPNSSPWSLIQEPFDWPQLFLYSAADDLIPCKYVETFASERHALGVKVFIHKFQNSAHVSHLKMHPDEYMATVNKFISVCLDADKKITSAKEKTLEIKLGDKKEK